MSVIHLILDAFQLSLPPSAKPSQLTVELDDLWA
jgi:hypothetical protein